jgi:phasin family protein
MDAQISFMTELSRKTYDSLRKISEINLHLAQQLIEDSVSAGCQLMQCTNPTQFAALAVNQVEPVSKHLRSYQEHLMGVLAGVQVELTRVTEQQLPDTGRSATVAAQEMTLRAAELALAYTRPSPADGAASPAHGANGANGTHYTPG